jgi:hypothetical protein
MLFRIARIPYAKSLHGRVSPYIDLRPEAADLFHNLFKRCQSAHKMRSALSEKRREWKLQILNEPIAKLKLLT